MRLTDAVTASVADEGAPAAVLALTYAASIDEATHLPLGHATALRLIEAAVTTAAAADPLAYAGAHAAFDKVAAALSAATVASDLGPKLLAALDALLLTPKARAAVGAAMGNAAPASPLQRLRDRHDSRHLRSAG